MSQLFVISNVKWNLECTLLIINSTELDCLFFTGNHGKSINITPFNIDIIHRIRLIASFHLFVTENHENFYKNCLKRLQDVSCLMYYSQLHGAIFVYINYQKQILCHQSLVAGLSFLDFNY